MIVEGSFGKHFDSVSVNGKKLRPTKSLKVMKHSPDGFSWGYGGSGPAQLALAILLHAGVDEDDAVRLHQQFKDDYVSKWPEGDFKAEFDLDDWLSMHHLSDEAKAERAEGGSDA